MGALSGYKILDFTTLLPGPFATMVLVDLGAGYETLKKETPAPFGVPAAVPACRVSGGISYKRDLSGMGYGEDEIREMTE